MNKHHKKKKTYQFGIWAEKIAMLCLRLKGYKILKWRFKSYYGEIDIIARKSNVIVVVEVKARKKKTLIEDLLRPRQINRIKKAAEFFIVKNLKYQHHYLRFDFIEVSRFFLIKHHKNFLN